LEGSTANHHLIPPPAKGKKEGETERVKSKKILVVDDDENTACMFQDALEAKGYNVEVAFSGEEVFEK